MNRPDCGYEIDELNESQPVCPRCGADPYDPDSWGDDPIVDALDDLEDIESLEEERELHEEPDSKLIN